MGGEEGRVQVNGGKARGKEIIRSLKVNMHKIRNHS
jgi:hypothetical protein